MVKVVELIYKEESNKIIGCAIEAHKTLKSGFLEPAYQEALSYELQMNNIPYEKEKLLEIHYKNIVLDKKYIADFVCYRKIILEIKAVNKLLPEHESQVLNYLNATGYKLGLILNFGTQKLEIKRIIL